MSKLTKRMRIIRNKIDLTKEYKLSEAITTLKELATAKFVESLDVAINLGIDARKSEQNVYGAIVLPHGIGKNIRIAVFAHDANVEAAKAAGADMVGMNNLAENIKNGIFNFDVVIASIEAMPFVGQLGQFLGPRGLMPNPKLGTVTSNVAETVKKIKSGQVRYRNDKNGIIHTTIGKINLDYFQLKENLETLLLSLIKAKPTLFKGIYLKKISLSTTMGVGIAIDKNSLKLT